MRLKVLIAPDKFKGTLASGAAAQAIARGWRKARPQDSLRLLPMSDGGDGFGQAMGRLLGATVQRTRTLDAAHRPCVAKWWWQPRTSTAVVESAAVIGLAMLPPNRFHPFELDTAGLAAVVRATAGKGAKRCLIGIGGSATNDGGFGLARELGWEFLDRSGHPINQWTGLDELRRIHAPPCCCCLEELSVAVDVQNPLLGRRGATRVYGPQKGLRSPDFGPAERCLKQLARIVRADCGGEFARVPGGGAAGGLGFGLLAFLGAKLEPGFQLFARYAALQRHLAWAELVITGEGAIDRSTFMGKGTGQIAVRCRRLKTPCIGLAGMVIPSAEARRVFCQTRALTDLTTAEQARANAAAWLQRLAMQTAHLFR
jgi:glycerate 2-kinase